MRVLGIETSCDETAVAVFDEKMGLMAHTLHSQIELHNRYGGVVPELASRDHVAKTIPLIESLLKNANISLDSIDGIAYTAGPGLIGALLVGASSAKALGFALNIPTIGIHHMEGHLLAVMLEDEEKVPEFPFLSLLVSGGHTLLIDVQEIGQYRILGQSLDDAAGEAFDKTAKLLGLGYPGGPLIAKLAEEGDPTRFNFPRPLTEKKGLDFSFSGLKTFAMNTLRNSEQTAQDKKDIAYAFQEAVIDTLVIKCKRAQKLTGHKRLVIAGGVSANARLRLKLKEFTQMTACETFFPKLEFCTDNAAMIAFAGCQRLKNNSDPSLEICVWPRWPMDMLKK